MNSKIHWKSSLFYNCPGSWGGARRVSWGHVTLYDIFLPKKWFTEFTVFSHVLEMLVLGYNIQAPQHTSGSGCSSAWCCARDANLGYTPLMGKRRFPSQGRISRSTGLVEVHLLSFLLQSQQVLRRRCSKASKWLWSLNPVCRSWRRQGGNSVSGHEYQVIRWVVYEESGFQDISKY